MAKVLQQRLEIENGARKKKTFIKRLGEGKHIEQD